MLRFLIAGMGLVLIATAANAQSNWCANDCVSLCRKTASSVQACVEQYRCHNYPKAPCAGTAVVNARAQKYNAQRAGSGGTMSYQACLARGTRAGWGTAETAAYCSRQGYR